MRNSRPLFVMTVLFALTCSLSATSLDRKLISVPLVFETNMGQVPSFYDFVSRHGAVESLVSSSTVDIVVPDGKAAARIRFRLIGSRSDVVPQSREMLPSVTNYLVGNDPSHWVRGIPNSGQVFYAGIYSGIDLLFHGNSNQLEDDFRIAAGADPSQIRLAIHGGNGIRVNSNGDLEVSLASGTLYFKKPRAYQETFRGRQAVSARFLINADHSVRFQLGPYDHSRGLVIDPVFSFSTYLVGSDSTSTVTAVTTDSAGNVYATGLAGFGFPIVDGIQPALIGTQNAFISKFDPTGHTLLYSTYLGGAGTFGDAENYASAIALDAKGNIIVAGGSGANDFPHAGKVPALTCQTNALCFFVSSLTPDGSSFNYSGLIGGMEGEFDPNLGVLTVDSAGNAYLGGITDDSTFAITPGTLAKSVPGYPYNSGFVLKLDPNGALAYCTIIPGILPLNAASTSVDVFTPLSLAVDSAGEATIAGTAGPGLPTTEGVVQPSFPNNLNTSSPNAGFVLQLNPTASSTKYATYVPGTDWLSGMATDGTGNLYLTGFTGETTLPVSANAYQKTLHPYQTSGFVLKMNGNGTKVLAATYLEGSSGASFSGIALDRSSHVFVGGITSSADFPLVDPFTSQWVLGDTNSDMVIAELSPDLNSLLFGSFLSSADQVYSAPQFYGLAVDSQGNLIVVGDTFATDFPTTANSFQPTVPRQAGEYQRGFIAKLDMTVPAPSFCPASWSLNLGDVPAKKSVTEVLNLKNCGNAALHVKSIISSAATVAAINSCSAVDAGSTCALRVTFNPRDSSTTSGTLTFNDDAAISPQVISFTGQGVAPQLSPSSGSVNFGHLLVNTTGAGNPLFFSNNGNAALVISSVSVDGDFSITQNACTGTVEAGFPCVIVVTFSPKAAGIRTGTLTIASNDPVHPTAGISLNGFGDTVYAAPVVTSLSSPTVQIKNGSVTVQVYGWNFYPASLVVVNGKPQSTTYSSSVQVQATLDSALTDAIGEMLVSVSNPSPGGGTSVGLPLTPYNVVDVDAAFLATVPGSTLLYASIPSSAPTNPNTVVPINPTTGALGRPIPVGNNPGILAASADGKYLFVAANQDQALQRINLATNAVDKTFPFPANLTTCCGALAATDLKIVPGTSEMVLALDIPEYGFGEMALYNDSGMVNSIPTSSDGTLSFSSFALAGNPPTIYALPFDSAQKSFFNVVNINSARLEYSIPPCCYGTNSSTGAQVVSDGKLLYTSAGEVWNPASQTQVGSFHVTTYDDTSYPNPYNLVMDAASGHMFVMGDQNYLQDSSSIVLSAYGQKSLALTGALAFPQVTQPIVQNLVRWGTSGFAFLGQGPAPPAQEIYLLTSSLANAVATNPVPKIYTLAPQSLPEDSPSFQLTINGTGFSQTSVINWNGVALQTTYASNQVLAAQVPGTNLSKSGSVPITVTTPSPGGGASNSASFEVSPLTPLISFSSSKLAFANQKAGTSSRPEVVAVQNPGTAPLKISSVKIIGSSAASFQEINNCGSTLAPGANCSLSITFKPVSVGTVTATVAFYDNAGGSPQVVSLTGTGD